MKTTKFKAWDKENKCWFEPTYEAYKGNVEDLYIGQQGDIFIRNIDNFIHQSIFPDRFILVFSTGLHDGNRAEVYRGDLVIDTNDDVWQVIWNEEEAGFFMKNVKTPTMLRMKNVKHCVVFGNVHENPEILEQAK